jgi:DNA invertase Pin-like site-specific DNA recombinase
MPEYVAYYRVSTDKQGIKGLGMDAPREAVTRFMAGKGELAAQFVEVESGKKDTNRLQLHAARGMLETPCWSSPDLIDSRAVYFICGLMNSDVEFVAVDMPSANRLTIHMLAAVAEHEREMISQRTKAALTAPKARGTTLGNPRAAEAAALARAAKNTQSPRLKS